MPVPIEYNSIRRMSTITVPKQDINFEYVFNFIMIIILSLVLKRALPLIVRMTFSYVYHKMISRIHLNPKILKPHFVVISLVVDWYYKTFMIFYNIMKNVMFVLKRMKIAYLMMMKKKKVQHGLLPFHFLLFHL